MVVQGRDLRALEDVVAPDSDADNSTFGCDFEFKPYEVTTLPMETALSVWDLPCWKGISQLKLDQQLEILRLGSARPEYIANFRSCNIASMQFV